MYQFELNDIFLYVSYLKDSNSNLPILNELSFSSVPDPIIYLLKVTTQTSQLLRSLNLICVLFPSPLEHPSSDQHIIPTPIHQTGINYSFLDHFNSHFDPINTLNFFISVAPVVTAHLNPDSIFTPYNHAFNHFFNLVLVPSRSYWVAFSSNLSLYVSILFLLLS